LDKDAFSVYSATKDLDSILRDISKGVGVKVIKVGRFLKPQCARVACSIENAFNDIIDYQRTHNRAADEYMIEISGKYDGERVQVCLIRDVNYFSGSCLVK
jgi:ATP-dependent DNA ligase